MRGIQSAPSRRPAWCDEGGPQATAHTRPRSHDPAAPRPRLPVAAQRRRPRTARPRAGTPRRGRTARRRRSPRAPRRATVPVAAASARRASRRATPRSSSSAYIRASPPWRIWNELHGEQRRRDRAPARPRSRIHAANSTRAAIENTTDGSRRTTIGRAGTRERRPQQVVERRMRVVGAQELEQPPTGSRAGHRGEALVEGQPVEAEPPQPKPTHRDDRDQEPVDARSTPDWRHRTGAASCGPSTVALTEVQRRGTDRRLEPFRAASRCAGRRRRSRIMAVTDAPGPRSSRRSGTDVPPRIPAPPHRAGSTRRILGLVVVLVVVFAVYVGESGRLETDSFWVVFTARSLVAHHDADLDEYQAHHPLGAPGSRSNGGRATPTTKHRSRRPRRGPVRGARLAPRGARARSAPRERSRANPSTGSSPPCSWPSPPA